MGEDILKSQVDTNNAEKKESIALIGRAIFLVFTIIFLGGFVLLSGWLKWPLSDEAMINCNEGKYTIPEKDYQKYFAIAYLPDYMIIKKEGNTCTYTISFQKSPVMITSLSDSLYATMDLVCRDRLSKEGVLNSKILVDCMNVSENWRNKN